MIANQQILSLWVGPDSQKTAHYFYSFQAEQFFQDNQDPTNHHSLWILKDKQMNYKQPRMIIFDTQSKHLTKIRNVDHKKLLKIMKKPVNDINNFSYQFFMPEKQQQKPQQQDPESFLYQNWEATQSNYHLIDKNFADENGFDFWQSLYNKNIEDSQDKVRKMLQRTDYVQLLTYCCDSDNLGYINKLKQYLFDECPKTSNVFMCISNKQNKNYLNQCFLPLMGSVIEDVDIFVDFDKKIPKNLYFQNESFYNHMSPVLNSLFTPFILKNASISHYIANIKNDNRSIFNLAHTLPIIDQDLNINQFTNIINYLPVSNQKDKKLNIEFNKQNRVNITSSIFLQQVQQKQKNKKNNSKQYQQVKLISSNLLSQSFVLKGHVKDITDKLQQRTNKFQIKYLQGILCSNPRQNLLYQPFFKQEYGQIVQNYPFHTVLFQHKAFGPSIRNYIKRNAKNGNKNQMIQQWQQKACFNADLYQQLLNEDIDE